MVWKKLRNENMWENKKSKRLIGIVRTYKDKKYIVTTVKGHWDNKTKDLGKFKTKPQAIKYVKDYMNRKLKS